MISYLHHLVEEQDTTWREPLGVVIFTSLKIYIKKKTYKTTLWTINTLETETNMAYLAFALDGDDYSYSVWP